MIELKNFTELTIEERMMVLSWRNHEEVRSYMYTHELITPEHHHTFVDSLSHRSDKRYFIVIKNGNPIGVIDLVDITNNSAVLGLYANPYSDRPGKGKIILRALIRYAFESLGLTTLYLECFEDNEKAKTLYEKFDFKVTGHTLKHGHSILTMELHRDHCPA